MIQNKLLYPAATALLCLLIFSCATKQSDRTSGKYSQVYVTNQAVYTVLPPEYMPYNMDDVHHVTADFNGKDFSAEVLVLANKEKLHMTLFSGFGSTVGELLFSGEAMSFQSSLFPSSLKPQYIIADFQFCFYDVQALTAALSRAGLSFKVSSDGNTEHRAIYSGKKCIAEMHKDGTSVQYINHLRKYSYNLSKGIF